MIHRPCLDHDELIGLNISTKIDNESFLFRTYINPNKAEITFKNISFFINIDTKN